MNPLSKTYWPRHTKEQQQVLLGFLMAWRATAVMTLDRQRAMAKGAHPRSGMRELVDYWSHAVGVIDWLIAHVPAKHLHLLLLKRPELVSEMERQLCPPVT